MNDIIVRHRPAYKPSLIAATPAVRTASPARSAVAPRPAPKRVYRQTAARPPRKMPYWLQILLATLLLLAGPMILQSDVLGQLAVVGYGVFAFVRRIPSRTTFTLALIAIVATVIFLVVRGNFTPAGNFATYTFLLLSVGVISLTREIKKEGGRVYSIKNNKA